MAKIGGFKNFLDLLKRTFKQWSEREPFNNSIIIAYYTIFSLPGLLIIIINVTGYFFGEEQVMNNITGQVQGMVGGNTAEDIKGIVENASKEEATLLSSVLAIATLLFGATGVFYQLQQILNKMWEVEPHPKQKIVKLIKDRVFSFGLILVVGFLLLVSLVLSAGLHALSDWLAKYVSDALVFVFKIIDVVASVGVITLLFAAIYKFLPDAKIRWSDVWIGALGTAVLFVIAKFALGLYFGSSNPASTYGAAGSIILIMLWVSYAGMILLFGAEFTQVYANRYGHKILPADGAVSTAGEGDNGAIVNKKKEKYVKNHDGEQRDRNERREARPDLRNPGVQERLTNQPTQNTQHHHDRQQPNKERKQYNRPKKIEDPALQVKKFKDKNKDRGNDSTDRNKEM